jgi:chromate transporter
MHHELVRRRRWVTEAQFLDLLSATYLIPGPNSTEMAIHLGFVRAGWPGLVAAGAAFITPAMLMVMALAALYVHFQTTPDLAGILYGVKPVVLALIAQAIMTWDGGQRGTSASSLSAWPPGRCICAGSTSSCCCWAPGWPCLPFDRSADPNLP